MWNTFCFIKNGNAWRNSEEKIMKTGNKHEKRLKRIVEIVTLDGSNFTGEICGNNSKGLLLREERSTNSDNPIFITHQTISYIKIIGRKTQTKKGGEV